MKTINKLVFPVLILVLWFLICRFELVPSFLLPSPTDTFKAFIENFSLIAAHCSVSLQESFAGLFLSIIFAIICAVIMDKFIFAKNIIFPGLVLSQTIPVIAIAPLLVLWFGYGMMPKIVLIFLVCFFPITVSLIGGLEGADQQQIRLFQSMGAGYFIILKEIKIPQALDTFFSGLRIAASYSIVGAVIAEWLGGSRGLGVYMTLARKNYAYDEMFAVILVVCVISLLLLKLIDLVQYLTMPYKRI